MAPDTPDDRDRTDAPDRDEECEPGAERPVTPVKEKTRESRDHLQRRAEWHRKRTGQDA